MTKKYASCGIFLIIMLLLLSNCSSDSEVHETSSSEEKRVAVIPVEKKFVDAKLEVDDLYLIKDQVAIEELYTTMPEIQDLQESTESTKEWYKLSIPTSSARIESLDESRRGHLLDPKEVSKYKKALGKTVRVIEKRNNGMAVIIASASLAYEVGFAMVQDSVDTDTQQLQVINEFQQRDFRSDLLTLLSQVEKIVEYKDEIIKDEETRKRHLDLLLELEGDVVKIVNQVNEEINGITSKTPENFNEYASDVNELALAQDYQDLAMRAFRNIADLSDLLAKGKYSKDFSYSLYNKYVDQTKTANTDLRKWHDKQKKEFGIDMKKIGVSRTDLKGLLPRFRVFLMMIGTI